MDAFAKKLKEYGMKIRPLSESAHRVEEEPLKAIEELIEDEMDADLYTFVSSYVDIFIENRTVFNQSFGILRKWEKIYDGVFTQISLEMYNGDVPEFYLNVDGYEIENWINKTIREDERKFIKMEKSYRLRKRFKPNDFIREMVSDQINWVDQFIEEMKGNDKLNQLVKELDEMIKRVEI